MRDDHDAGHQLDPLGDRGQEPQGGELFHPLTTALLAAREVALDGVGVWGGDVLGLDHVVREDHVIEA